MLTALRTFSKSWVAAILIGLLILSFAVWGVNDVFTTNMGDEVVRAGSRVISSSEFQREYSQAKEQAEQRSGQPITPEMASANGLDRSVLSGVATREAYSEMISRMEIRPSDELIVTEIEKIPTFFDQISGRFDRAIFDQRLGEAGLTAKKFDQVLRDERAGQHFASAIANGLRLPRAYGALAAVYALESRNLAYITIIPPNVEQPAAPTDDELTAFMQEIAAQLTRPEMRVMTIARFQVPEIPAATLIDEAELEALYNFRKDTLSQPELRTFVQIPARTAADAQKVVDDLGRGEEAATIADGLGVDPISYENKPKTAVADRQVGEAAFSMTAGQVEIVQGELGQAVVKLISVTLGRAVSLADARPALEAELRQNAAAEQVFAQTETYDQAHQAGTSLVEAAEKAGVRAISVGPVTQQGLGVDGLPDPNLTRLILQQAFSLPTGGETELTETAQGDYFAVRLEQVLPPAMPPLAEIRNELALAWLERELFNGMEARANEIATRIREGETLYAVAASTGLNLARLPGLTRQNASQIQQLPGEIISRAFRAKTDEVFVVRPPQLIVVVGQVSNVRVEAGADAANLAEQSRPELTTAVFRELNASAQAAARIKVKTRVDLNRARAAIGMEPLTTSSETGN